MSRPIRRKSREQQNEADADENSLLISEQNVVASTSRSSPGSSRANCISTTVHFDKCLKLFIENKINKKNAWNFELIDITCFMLRENHPTLDNLIMASMVIGASARIYALRMDALHSDVLNMAGGLPKYAQAKRRKIINVECESPNCPDTEAGHSKKRIPSKAGEVFDPEELNETTVSMVINIDDDGESRKFFNTTLPINEEAIGLMSRENTISDRQEEKRLDLSLQEVAFDINADVEPVIEDSNNEDLSKSTAQHKGKKRRSLKKKKQLDFLGAELAYDSERNPAPEFQPAIESNIRPVTGVDRVLLRQKPKRNAENKGRQTLEDNQNRNLNNDTSFSPNNILDGRVESHEEPTAGTSRDQIGAVDTDELGEMPEAPTEVTNYSLPYALRPKKIDMKELINSTWNLLTENTQDGEDFPPNTLSNICSKLPSKLTKNMRESLSLPLVFLSVLHLATEKGLALEKKDDLLNDIIIRGNNKK